MMDTISKLTSSIGSIFEFNQATFGGCVDIVVVEQSDGSLKSTPFHVRFGSLQVVKSKEKVVKIHVNGIEAGFTMQLGHAGEGFFPEDSRLDHSAFFPSSEIINQEDLTDSQPSDSPNIPQHRHIKGGKRSHFASPLLIPNEEEVTRSASPIREKNNNKLKGMLDMKNFATRLETNDSPTLKKSLRPTSQKLKSLHLKLGMNTITFTVETQLQGTHTVTGHIYLWPADAKVIISDIDGTITKSDIIGHLFTFFGKDWSHEGIAPLYTSLREHGYYILYLTARAIGQSKTTKDYLNGIIQDGKMLPPGPVVLSPDGFLPSVKREVIMRRPELFKIATLKDIKRLFPEGYNPFFAGFGNRETDSIAYRVVGVPLENLFLINPKGHITQYNSHAVKSYPLIHSQVKEIFPHVSNRKGHTKDKKIHSSHVAHEEDKADKLVG